MTIAVPPARNAASPITVPVPLGDRAYEILVGRGLLAGAAERIAALGARAAAIVTDELAAYPKAAADFAGGHHTVNHSQKNYVRTDGRHTNTAESFFARCGSSMLEA